MSIAERRTRGGDNGWRLRALRFFFLALGLVIIVRLFTLQVLSATFYKTLAEGQYSLYEELVPERGRIYVRDHDDMTEYPVATAAPRAFVYADPRKVTDPIALGKDIARILKLEGLEEYERFAMVEQLRAAGRITEVMELENLIRQARLAKTEAEAKEAGLDPAPTADSAIPDPLVAGVTTEPVPALEPLTLEGNQVAALIARLSKVDDPYEPVARNVTDEQLDLLKTLETEALDYVIEGARSYPEPGFGGQVLGFLGRQEDGQPVGLYGLEGYFDDFLSGQAGKLYSQTDVSGRFIGVGDRSLKPAIDGGDLLLTIDRTLQVEVCDILSRGVEKFKADSGTAVILEPSTGRVLAMCGAPDFYPQTYAEVEDASVYNNTAIFSAYEPGSIFKPITMAAALDVGAVTPESRFTDPGSVTIDEFTIRNAADKVFGNVSMIEVLEESINTGMVWVMRQMGRDNLKDYIHAFGFGEQTGIELKNEVAGTVASLEEKAEVYPATASFGQGITVTPLQIATAYAALANGGKLMRPYIVEEMRYPDGTVERTEPHEVRQVISPSSATTIGAMLVSVVEYGHGKKAGVPGYYIAGKTGTAQIARNGVYSATEFNGSFAGYGPVHDPKFSMIVKIENPKDGVIYAESTAAPVFGEIAAFLLEYYNIAPERAIE
jgi:stage V sporulation protein D (sporulation-specific penicillin-binding protein)